MYGLDVADSSDPTLAAVESGLMGTREILVAGAFLVDYFPILQHAPEWVPFQRRFKMWREDIRQMKDIPFQRYKESAKDGIAAKCVVGELISKNKGEAGGDAEKFARDVAGVVFSAGSDTVSRLLAILRGYGSCPCYLCCRLRGL